MTDTERLSEKCRLPICSIHFDQKILYDLPGISGVDVYEGWIVATLVSEAELCLKGCCSLGKQTLHHICFACFARHLVT